MTKVFFSILGSLVVLMTSCIIDWPMLDDGHDADADVDTDIDADADVDADADGGDGGDADEVVCDGPCAAPTVSLETSSECVPEGGSLHVSWESTNATSCIATGPAGAGWDGARDPTGEETLENPVTGRYELACNGPGGTGHGFANVMADPGGHPDDALRARYGTPVIDGIDDDWESVVTDIDDLYQGEEPPTLWDLSARFGVAWDREFLYFVVVVVDDINEVAYDGDVPIWTQNHDGLEFMINGLNNDPRFRDDTPTIPIYDVDDHKLHLSAHDAFSAFGRDEDFPIPLDGDLFPEGADVYHQVILEENADYVAEIAIRWEFLIPDVGFEARPGTLHGMDIAVIDNDREGGDELRETVLMWIDTDFYYRDTRGFGTMVLTCD